MSKQKTHKNPFQNMQVNNNPKFGRTKLDFNKLFENEAKDEIDFNQPQQQPFFRKSPRQDNNVQNNLPGRAQRQVQQQPQQQTLQQTHQFQPQQQTQQQSRQDPFGGGNNQFSGNLSGNIQLGNLQDPNCSNFGQGYDHSKAPTFVQDPIYPCDDIDEDCVPLLEDIGIDIHSIKRKFLCILSGGYFKTNANEIVEEADLTGPLIVAFCFISFLLMALKNYGGQVYGYSLFGSFIIYVVINFLSQNQDIPFYDTMSILGYCMAPLAILAAINIFLVLKTAIGFVLTTICISWATYMATKFFDIALNLEHQKYLIAYPIFLYYFTFILLTIF